MASSTTPEMARQQRSSPPGPSPIDGDLDSRHTPQTPSTGSVEFPLLSDAQARISRTHTVSPTFVSSPLNPNTSPHITTPPSLFTRSSTQSRQSMILNRVPSEESQALTFHRPLHTPNRTSMLLYRLSDGDDQRTISPLTPNRQSLPSYFGESSLNVSYDSKYPARAHTPRKLIPYPFDPSLHIDTPEDDDALHDPSDNTPLHASTGIAIRGFINIGVLVLVIAALLCLFIFYPIWHFVIQGNGTVP